MSSVSSFPMDKIGEIPDHRLPLSVHFKHTRVFDEDRTPAEAKQQLKDLLKRHGGPIVEVTPLGGSLYGLGSVEATFFHPGSMKKFIHSNGLNDLINERSSRFSLQVTADISNRPEDLSLWIGGCPEWQEDLEKLKEAVRGVLKFNYMLEILEDPLRKELIVTSPIAIKNIQFKMDMLSMIREALKNFESNPIKWRNANRLLLVKGASDEFVRKWKERLDGRLPLSDEEEELMLWTEQVLEKRRTALAIPPIVPEPSKTASPKKAWKTPARKRRIEHGRREHKKKEMEGEEESHNGNDAEEGKMEEVKKCRVDDNHNELEEDRTNGIEIEETNEQGEMTEQGEQDMANDQQKPQQANPLPDIETPVKISEEHISLDSLRNLLERFAIRKKTPIQRRTRNATDSRGSSTDGGQASSSTESSCSGRSNASSGNGKEQKTVGKKEKIVPSYLHPEEAEEKMRKYKEDSLVRMLQVRLEKERRERGEGPLVMDTKISKNDFASITRKADQMHAWLHPEEEEDEEEAAARKRNKKRKMIKCKVKKISGNEKKYIIDGFPFSTPRNADGTLSYHLLTTMDDSQGPLECYDTRQPTIKTDEDNGEGSEGPVEKPHPNYKFISKNEEIGDRATASDYHDLREANTCETSCSCVDECRPETCACMKRSLYIDGKIQEVLMTDDRWTVYECCSSCSCHKRKEKCASIVKFRKIKFHLVHFNKMGFALRVMEPVARGEPIVDFTGVYESSMTEDNKDWAFTCVNLAEEFMRTFTGILDSVTCMLLTPRYKGNSGGRVCHSKDNNVEFMRVYRGGMSTLLPECLIFATENIQAGDLLWLNYGEDYWSHYPDQPCLCLQELCHDKETIAWLKTLTYDQIREVLIMRELTTRQRIINKQKEVLKQLDAQEKDSMQEDKGENVEDMKKDEEDDFEIEL